MKDALHIAIPIEQLTEAISQAVVEKLESTNSSSKDSELETREETAKRLRISLPTLNRYTKKGIIKAHRVGGRVLYKRAEVDSALKEIQLK